MNKLFVDTSDRLSLRASTVATRMTLLVLTAGIITLIITGCQTKKAFEYNPPGELVPNSGQGRVDHNVYLAGMRFPLAHSPAYANSQVYGVGGLHGPAGSQCDERNYSYPWTDNYCETRTWDMPLCPSGKGHQGQDIRPPDCTDSTHWAVAVEDGTIIHIGSYSVYLQGDSGIRHRYLHLDHDQLAVSIGQQVKNGDRIGLISDNMGSTATTIHLHFDMYSGGLYIPTYMSLVEAYKDLIEQ
ncbi:MAG: M23 family metallopeptidase [Desulfobacterales bacterium]|jgi:murein DD-endopeptidase MepM/ murein hydrolase activator NlpD